jgi:hypothetical protein
MLIPTILLGALQGLVWAAPTSTVTSTGGVCCPQKTVASVGDEFDGVYTLIEERGAPAMAECKDACVYYRGRDKTDTYCFRAATASEMGSGKTQCEAITSPFSSYLPPSSTSSPSAAPSTPKSTTPLVNPDLDKAEEDLSGARSNLTAQETKLNETKEEKAATEEEEGVLNDLGDKIDALLADNTTTTVSSRVRREEGEEVTCKVFKEKVRAYNDEDTSALDTAGKKNRNKRGKVIAKFKVKICTTEDKDGLKIVKTKVILKIKDVAAAVKNLEELEKAIEKVIEEVNEYIKEKIEEIEKIKARTTTTVTSTARQTTKSQASSSTAKPPTTTPVEMSSNNPQTTTTTADISTTTSKPQTTTPVEMSPTTKKPLTTTPVEMASTTTGSPPTGTLISQQPVEMTSPTVCTPNGDIICQQPVEMVGSTVASLKLS